MNCHKLSPIIAPLRRSLTDCRIEKSSSQLCQVRFPARGDCWAHASLPNSRNSERVEALQGDSDLSSTDDELEWLEKGSSQREASNLALFSRAIGESKAASASSSEFNSRPIRSSLSLKILRNQEARHSSEVQAQFHEQSYELPNSHLSKLPASPAAPQASEKPQNSSGSSSPATYLASPPSSIRSESVSVPAARSALKLEPLPSLLNIISLNQKERQLKKQHSESKKRSDKVRPVRRSSSASSLVTVSSEGSHPLEQLKEQSFEGLSLRELKSLQQKLLSKIQSRSSLPNKSHRSAQREVVKVLKPIPERTRAEANVQEYRRVFVRSFRLFRQKGVGALKPVFMFRNVHMKQRKL